MVLDPSKSNIIFIQLIHFWFESIWSGTLSCIHSIIKEKHSISKGEGTGRHRLWRLPVFTSENGGWEWPQCRVINKTKRPYVWRPRSTAGTQEMSSGVSISPGVLIDTGLPHPNHTLGLRAHCSVLLLHHDFSGLPIPSSWVSLGLSIHIFFWVIKTDTSWDFPYSLYIHTVWQLKLRFQDPPFRNSK